MRTEREGESEKERTASNEREPADKDQGERTFQSGLAAGTHYDRHIRQQIINPFILAKRQVTEQVTPTMRKPFKLPLIQKGAALKKQTVPSPFN